MAMFMWKMKAAGQRIKELLKNEQGIGVVEVILILVGKFTSYYAVGIACTEKKNVNKWNEKHTEK